MIQIRIVFVLTFRQRDEAASRNSEIYAYNPLTVPLN
jgi:hypothetical protein